METAKAMSLLTKLVTNFSPLQPRLNPRTGHARLVMDKIALRQVFFEYLPIPISSTAPYSLIILSLTLYILDTDRIAT
jgi:hypothetical protein